MGRGAAVLSGAVVTNVAPVTMTTDARAGRLTSGSKSPWVQGNTVPRAMRCMDTYVIRSVKRAGSLLVAVCARG